MKVFLDILLQAFLEKLLGVRICAKGVAAPAEAAAPAKNEALNGSETLFVNKHPDLRVQVVHGNTLTAAVILNEISEDVTEVFLTGATSKLGRAIAFYLCQKRIRVLVSSIHEDNEDSAR